MGGDHSQGGKGDDGTLSSGALPASGGSWTATGGQLRGGFRYLTVRLLGGATSGASVTISGVSLAFTAAPEWGDDLSVCVPALLTRLARPQERIAPQEASLPLARGPVQHEPPPPSTPRHSREAR